MPHNHNMPFQSYTRGNLWQSISSRCPSDMAPVEWHRTHHCLRVACDFLGMDLVTSESQPDAMATPKNDYFRRQVVVARCNKLCKPTSLNNVLSCKIIPTDITYRDPATYSPLLTPDEAVRAAADAPKSKTLAGNRLWCV